MLAAMRLASSRVSTLATSKLEPQLQKPFNSLRMDGSVRKT